jgi:hypothetical protein
MSSKHRHEHNAEHGSGMEAAADQAVSEVTVETPSIAETTTATAAAADTTEASVPAAVATTETAAAAPVASIPSTKDGAKVLLADGTPRIDYIRKRYAEGATRSVITKEVNEKRVAGTEPVPYQIIFAATKGLAKPAVAEAPAAAASEAGGEAVTEAPAEAAA